LQVTPQDAEDAIRLQASIALHNESTGQQHQRPDELRSQILMQQFESLKQISNAEVTTAKAFKSYKEP
jgi:hypothetical protein